MFSPWSDDIWRLAALFAFTLALGALTGYVWPLLTFGLAFFLVLQWRKLHALHQWLVKKRKELPDSTGIWGDVFYQVYRIKQRNRKRKQRLMQILARFRQSTAAMPDATVILQDNGDIEWMNKAAGEYLGLRTPDDIGKHIGNFIRHPKFRQYLSDGDYSKPVEIPARTDKSIILSVMLIPYGKKQRLLIARDITQLRNLEQVRRDFVANASHELRTPLTVLAGLVETLDENVVSEADRQRAMKLMRQQSKRMQQIVEDLLLLTQLESDRPRKDEPIAIPSLILTTVEEAKMLSGGHHRFIFEIEDDLWIYGEEKELFSVLMNLLSNAVRYTPKDGQITVRWKKSDSEAVFEVQDSGIGIAKQHIERLTERFYRVDIGRSRSSGGTGLGLAIVKHVLDRHGGRLEIVSELGKGSTFRCFLPANRIYMAHRQAG